MPEDKKMPKGNHTISMDFRERINVTGVIDVLSFDEQTINIDTDLGLLVIRGDNLHVNRLNLDNGELDIDGEIDSLIYEEQSNFTKGRASLFGKLFK